MKNPLSRLRMAAILSLTLGLAPFVPSPHIIGKIKWVMGGGIGMKPIDYFDLLLHGFPWVFLLIALIQVILYYGKRKYSR